MTTKCYCHCCGSEEIYIPQEQNTTGVQWKCNRCGALMYPTAIFFPGTYKLNPVTGRYERVE